MNLDNTEEVVILDYDWDKNDDVIDEEEVNCVVVRRSRI